MSLILMTTPFYKSIDVWRWSLSGFKGLSRSSWPWGFDALDPSTWIFTSVSEDSSPHSYLITSGRLCPSTFSHSTKVWHTTYPISDAPLLRSVERGAASLRYRNRAEITALLCEQKHYPVWFSCWRKSIDYSVNIALDTSACILASLIHQKVSPQLFRCSPSLHCLTGCVQRSSESSSS